jgi:hypothetical protein
MYSLLSEIHQAGYVLEGNLKDRVEQIVSVQAKDARVYHPTFGSGKVVRALGEYNILVLFDKDKPKNADRYYHSSRMVAIHKLLSLDILIKKELEYRESLKPKPSFSDSGHGNDGIGKYSVNSNFND